jgi:hypothetical protein
VDWVLDRLGQELDLVRGQLSSVHAAERLVAADVETDDADVGADVADDQEPT